MALPAFDFKRHRPWTMRAFITWAFGPRELVSAAELVLAAQQEVERLDDGSAALHLKDLARLAWDLMALADQHRWRAEGDLAAALNEKARTLEPSPLLRRHLRAGFWRLSRMVEARIANNAGLLCRELVDDRPAGAQHVIQVDPWDV